MSASRTSRSRSSTGPVNKGRRLVRGARRLLAALSANLLVCSIPLLLYLFVNVVDHLLLMRFLSGELLAMDIRWDPSSEENAAEKFAAELDKQKYQAAGYLVSLALLLGRVRELLRFFRSEIALSSDVPERVFANFVHMSFGFLAVWQFLSHPRVRERPVLSVGLILLAATGTSLVMSVALFFMHPMGGIPFLLSENRYGGLSGNPNSLGSIALLTVFGALTMLKSGQAGRWLWALAIALLACAAFALNITGSATSTGLAALVVTLFVLHAIYERFGWRGRVVLIMGSLTTLVVTLMVVVVVQQRTLAIAEEATEAVGKDLSLTGRVDLWQVGLEAFLTRPILGWGYDNHESVYADGRYEVPYVHYHNGYIDNLVIGGLVLGIPLLLCFSRFARHTGTLLARRVAFFPFVVAVAFVSLHNMTEYSMFRATTPLFTTWLIGYVAVAMLAADTLPRLRGRSRTGPRVRRRSGRRQYSWR